MAVELQKLLQQSSYPLCDKEGLLRHYNIYHGMTIDADEVEKVIARLYESIDKLTTAYDEADK